MVKHTFFQHAALEPLHYCGFTTKTFNLCWRTKPILFIIINIFWYCFAPFCLPDCLSSILWFIAISFFCNSWVWTRDYLHHLTKVYVVESYNKFRNSNNYYRLILSVSAIWTNLTWLWWLVFRLEPFFITAPAALKNNISFKSDLKLIILFC